MSGSGKAVPSKEFVDLEQNMLNVDKFANSTELELTNRTSPNGNVTTKTLAGLVKDVNEAIENTISKSNIGVWTQGVTTFTSLNEYSEFNGVSYKPKSGITLPYTAQTSSPLTAPDSDNVEPFSDVNTSNIASITSEFTDLVFGTIDEMVAGIQGVIYSTGMKLKVQGENDRTTNYIVKNTQADIDLGGGLWAKAVSGSISTSPATWYVDPVLGSDSYDKGSAPGVDAFRTIQYAYDSLPSVIIHQQTIQLADGVYNDNYLDPARSVEMPRPAILFGRGKFIAARTQKNGNDMEGGVVIKGNQSNPELVVWEPNNTYNYGFYNAQGQIAIQDFVIRPSADATNIVNLMISHRATSRIHSLNVSLDGRDKTVTQRALLVESGGQIEFTTTLNQAYIRNAAILASNVTAGDLINISGNWTMDSADTGVRCQNGGSVTFAASGISGQSISNCSDDAVTILGGGYVGFRGKNTSERNLIDGNVSIDTGGILNTVWCDINGQILSDFGVVELNTSDYQGAFVAKGGDVYLSNVNSYISPNTQNDAVIPLGITYDTRIYKEGTVNLVGSSGGPESYNPQTLSYTGNTQTQNIVDGVDVYRVFGNGANRTNCTIGTTGVAEGRTIYLDGDSWGVEFVNSSSMDIATPFSLGSGTGAYTGAVLTLRDGKWRVNSLGQVRS